MRINNNSTAINSHRQYGINNKNIGKNMERHSSGFRINRASDDAAGLAISEKMRAQVRGLNQASRNSQDAVSLVQTAEGGMQTIQDVLQRMRELTVQAGNETNNSAENQIDLDALQAEFDQLIDEIDQIANTTEFNAMKILNAEGGDNGKFTMQVGANHEQTMEIEIGDLTSNGIGNMSAANGKSVNDLRSDGEIGKRDGALTDQAKARNETLQTIDSAINCVSMARANLGAYQNRLEFKIQNLNNQSENVSAAESRVRDADMAQMMTEFTRNSILFQASTAMLAQANSQPQSVLQLLG
jgi:flagellin